MRGRDSTSKVLLLLQALCRHVAPPFAIAGSAALVQQGLWCCCNINIINSRLRYHALPVTLVSMYVMRGGNAADISGCVGYLQTMTCRFGLHQKWNKPMSDMW